MSLVLFHHTDCIVYNNVLMVRLVGSFEIRLKVNVVSCLGEINTSDDLTRILKCQKSVCWMFSAERAELD